jgi:hypothetical protein
VSSVLQDAKGIELLLTALGEQLGSMLDKRIELLVCGGAALNLVGLVQRTTEDVDILAIVTRNSEGNVSFVRADPLNSELATAARKVARDFNLPENWLNPGPASAVDLGLPEGVLERVVTRHFGKQLIVHFLGRYDQIHFKLYAAVDQGAGKHLDDLLALKPTETEIEQAARWSMTHDVSEGYKHNLKSLLEYIGFKDAAGRL